MQISRGVLAENEPWVAPVYGCIVCASAYLRYIKQHDAYECSRIFRPFHCPLAPPLERGRGMWQKKVECGMKTRLSLSVS